MDEIHYHFHSNQPIGMLDSGVGGLGVARELVRVLPHEHLIYVGDTAHFPYGTRTSAEIMTYMEELIPFFLQHSAKLLVLACNTASSVLLTREHDLSRLKIPMIGVIEAGARVAARTTRNGHVGILATEQTICSGAYQRAIQSINPEIRVIGQPASKLVELVESGNASQLDVLTGILEQAIQPILAEGADTVVLGCTHFLSLQRVIEQLYPNLSGVINPAAETVQQIAEYLGEKNLLASSEMTMSNVDNRSFYITGNDIDHFCRLGSELMGRPIKAEQLQRSVQKA